MVERLCRIVDSCIYMFMYVYVYVSRYPVYLHMLICVFVVRFLLAVKFIKINKECIYVASQRFSMRGQIQMMEVSRTKGVT